MTDPSAAFYPPHIMGVTLDTEGIASTIVIAYNRRTGESQRGRANSSKQVIFDAVEFTSGYAANDIIEFTNTGGSKGFGTLTITNATGGFQELSMDCIASPTVSVNL